MFTQTSEHVAKLKFLMNSKEIGADNFWKLRMNAKCRSFSGSRQNCRGLRDETVRFPVIDFGLNEQMGGLYGSDKARIRDGRYSYIEFHHERLNLWKSDGIVKAFANSETAYISGVCGARLGADWEFLVGRVRLIQEKREFDRIITQFDSIMEHTTGYWAWIYPELTLLLLKKVDVRVGMTPIVKQDN